jgi:hypothetical protein
LKEVDMGYGHAWHIPLEGLPLVQERLSAILEDFGRLLPHLPPLAGPLGEGEPVFGPSEVAFNGPRPEDYEGFAFPGLLEGKPFLSSLHPGHHYGFCKTGRRPYDLAVQAFLLVAKAHLGEYLALSSDGAMADWAEAADLVEAVLGLLVDLEAALGVRLVEVEDGQGRRFLFERSLKAMAEGKPLPPHLERLEAFLPSWPFRGPYRVLGEARLFRPVLKAAHLGMGVYRVKATP